MLTAQQLAVERGVPVAAESAGCVSTGATSSSRCRCSLPRTSTTPPQGDRRRPGAVRGFEVKRTGGTHPPRVRHAVLQPRRPDRLAGVRPQERVPRHNVEQIVDSAPVLPLLHAPVPQTVDSVGEVLVPDVEQVIDVPKIPWSSHWSYVSLTFCVNCRWPSSWWKCP